MNISIDINVEMPMRDGTILRGDVYRPASGQCPAILFRTGYNKSGRSTISGDLLPMMQALSAGYAFVVQDLRGRFASDGEWIRNSGSPYAAEINDGFDTIEWVAAQSWCDGSVATAGGSYLANVQWPAAAAHPPHLKAMTPWIGRSGMYLREDAQLAGVMKLFLDASWTANMGVDMANRMEREGHDVTEMRRMIRRAQTHPEEVWYHVPLAEAPHFKFPGLDRLWGGMLHQANPEPGMEADWPYHDIEVPALHVGGWFDLNIYSTFRNYQGLRDGGATETARAGQHVIVGPWAHGVSLGAYLGGINFGTRASGDAAGLGRWHIEFYDKYLRGKDVDIPTVRYFTMGANEWQIGEDWPLPDTRWTRFYLHSGGRANTAAGNGSLGADEPRGEPPDKFLYDPEFPVPTTGGHFTPSMLAPGPVEQSSVLGRSDVLCYKSEPLESDLEVTGPLIFHLCASTTGRDTDFTAKLIDFHPDGRGFNVADGVIRARFRHSVVQPELLEPGQPYEYDIHLRNTSMLFRRGHRLGIVVSSSDFPRWDRNMNTGGRIGYDKQGMPAVQTVFHDSERPSYIDLPLRP